MRIAIIGAGPAGSESAKLLAQAGHQVEVFEEHKEIGKPVQCTGIVTAPFQALMGTEGPYVINKIDTIRIYSPTSGHAQFTFDHADWIIDRTAFDQHLADEAKKAGATYHTHHRFTSMRTDGSERVLTIADDEGKKTIEHRCDLVVGADGPLSSVAKAAGLFGERKFFFGVQPIVSLENDNAIEVYPAKTGFCWVTPISAKRAKAGIAAEQQANQQLKAFMSQRFGPHYHERVLSTEGGLVPVYNPKQIVEKDHVCLVGDASTAAKATTAGGIIQAIISARALAQSVKEKKSYQKLWRERLHTEMSISLRMRRMLNKFSDKDYADAVRWINKPSTKRILETHSRDYPSQFVLKLMLSQPRLLSFARYVL